ncbi:MAG: hypothetical protein HWD58_00225 [Bacteroidota bacterium]|nr:MAG: hypothetical protein HWD58_00225 [Bacteroidota bacterium]
MKRLNPFKHLSIESTLALLPILGVLFSLSCFLLGVTEPDPLFRRFYLSLSILLAMTLFQTKEQEILKTILQHPHP